MSEHTRNHRETRNGVQPLVGAITITATKNREGATVNLTGGPATANVVFVINMPGGGILTLPAVTNGSGAATVTFVPNSPGTITVNVTQPNPSTAVAGPTTAPVY